MTNYTLPSPSPLLQAGFWIFALVIALSLPILTWRTTQKRGATAFTLGLAVGWVTLTGLLTRWARFHSFELPPPFLITVFLGALGIVALVMSPLGKELVSGATLAGLVLFQGFRFPLELLMHRAYEEGLMPVQMSYDGRNLDILTGISALILGSILLWQTLPKALLWIWNVAGLGLLINVVGVAILSTPTPFRQFHNDPPNIWILDAPFVWLPMVMVMAALFGHLAVARKLLSAD
jgi:small-conductance mechanosensitive channel